MRFVYSLITTLAIASVGLATPANANDLQKITATPISIALVLTFFGHAAAAASTISRTRSLAGVTPWLCQVVEL
ncbi:hypothetical protein N7537_007417 [Penicillium hordei]|uniref:Uncharacterized protein n=1 Tax=Penicillium hordei TaxID=40994 RepID=A0AAD6H0M5_9EURO|nr:uncharacterized protein N7537_007417 [Penicillium hordei]KAJ5597333.1 hypothetical protein N7537_007417 [Penicillium hordei]